MKGNCRIKIKDLIKISRPVSWIIFPLIFYSGLLLGGAKFSFVILLILFSLSFPLCLYGYCINDIYDYKTDIRNPRKKSILEGYIVYPKCRNILKKISFLSILPLIISVLLTKNFLTVLMCLLLIFIGYSYSAPPIRLKEKPPFDSLSNGLIYFFLPFSLGYSLSGSFVNFPLFKTLFLTLCVSSIHAVGTMMDYSVDKSVGIKTFAVRYGQRTTAIFAFFTFFLSFLLGNFGVIIKMYLLFCSILTFLLIILPNEFFAKVVFKSIFIGFLFFICLFFLSVHGVLIIYI